MALHVSPPLADDSKSIVPVGPTGAPEPGAVTRVVALRFTACPDTAFPGEAITEVVVEAGVTVAVASEEVDVAKFRSPE
jgi:hypothetical protein